MKKQTKKPHKTLEDALMAFRYAMTSTLVKEAKQKGCTLSHFEVMKYIAEKGNPHMKEIAVQLHITPPSASALIDTLVSKKLVTRTHTPEDRRTVRVTLTPIAQALLLSIYGKKGSVFDKMLSKLGSEDKNELARILIKCISI